MRKELCRHCSRFLVASLTGHAKVGVTIFVYSICALLLLAYVSVQIYAGVLTREIAGLKQERGEQRETRTKLTAEFISLSSRSRIGDYCEQRLGMVRVGGKNFEVLAVNLGESGLAAPAELTEERGVMPPAYGYTYRQTKENPGQ